ncbi:cell surface glycoprotein MUC18 [Hyperolius riggenbachi]|uniref:cell surface glycoprotein MUC18 n=1 Tax=Hyperolius riggenbachi TaxID=752182 RepID=UPI0035A276EE
MSILILLSLCLLSWRGTLGQHGQEDNTEIRKANLDERVVLPCAVFSSNATVVQWLYIKDQAGDAIKIYTSGPGAPVKEDSNMKSTVDFGEDAKLVIDKVQVQHNKTFVCRVEHENGVKEESRIQLRVYKKPSRPEITMERDLSVTNDPTKISTCESKNGFPAPIFKWYKNGHPLREGENNVKISTQVTTESNNLITVRSTLSAPVQKSDASAVFYCAVSYDLKAGRHMQESSRENITVYYPNTEIRVYMKGPSKMIKEGDLVRLVCEGDGNPQPETSIYKKGIDSELEETSWNVSRGDSGEYVCRAFDTSTGEDLQNETTLVVHFMDPPVISHTTPVTMELQTNLMVMCEATASIPPEIHWEQDGRTIANGSVLILDSVDYSDMGLYTCVAELPGLSGLIERADMQVIVRGSPQAFVTSSVLDVREGETVTANCNANGYPLSQITWYINGTEVTSQAVTSNISDYEVSSELSLLVEKDFVNKSLKCMVQNMFNSSTAFILLLEMETPVEKTVEPPRKPEGHGDKSYGVLIVIVIICILALAVLGAVLYFLYKKGQIPCGRSGKKEITKPGSKGQIVVEMKPDSPAEESVLLPGSQDKLPLGDQEKYMDLRN